MRRVPAEGPSTAPGTALLFVTVIAGAAFLLAGLWPVAVAIVLAGLVAFNLYVRRAWAERSTAYEMLDVEPDYSAWETRQARGMAFVLLGGMAFIALVVIALLIVTLAK